MVARVARAQLGVLVEVFLKRTRPMIVRAPHARLRSCRPERISI
jgi:hypothetical protein